jgi:hypothetical protein
MFSGTLQRTCIRQSRFAQRAAHAVFGSRMRDYAGDDLWRDCELRQGAAIRNLVRVLLTSFAVVW